jgi:putative ABC transport system permease protein
VSTSLRERPSRTGAGHGGGPARRAVVRWAWRLLRREWRQQLLVLALVTVAVAATTAGAAIVTSTPSSPEAVFGTASHLVSLPGADPHLAASIAAIRHRFGVIDVIENQAIDTGSVDTVDLRAQDPAGAYGHPTLALVAGRYPARRGQVAVTGQVALIFNVRVGSVWPEGGRARRVVGLVENPENLLDEFALVAPGQVSAPTQVTVLFDASRASIAAFRFPDGVSARTLPASSARNSAAVVVLALATLGLLFIGLVAVAGFTVMAQRRLRALGMLGALGATDRHVRLALVANGAVVGTVGALAGAAIGLAGWVAFVPRLQTIAEHRIDRLSLPWWLIAVAMLLAIVTAIAASWWPARAAAAVPVVAALSGRTPRPERGHRLAVPGGLLLAAGLGFLAFADDNGGIPPLVVAGVVATTLGILFIAPLCVARLGAAGRRAPIAVRLALRDLARYQARSGAALAAITFAVGIAATITIATTQAAAQAAEAAPAGPNLPANQLIVHISAAGAAGTGLVPEQTPAGLQDLRARVHALAASLRATGVLALDAAVDPRTASQRGQGSPAGDRPTVALVKVIPGCAAPGVEGAGQVYVATPALLRHYGIRPGGIDPAADILTSRTDLAGVRLATADSPAGCSYDSDNQFIRQPTIQAVRLPADTSDPSTLLSTRALHVLGWQAIPAGWLIQTAGPLTAAQINAGRQMALAAGVSIETRSASGPSQLRDWATAAGLLLALGVLAMTVGLIRSETASDLRTLTAVGASGATRRTITGATAGALALLGALLGTAVAYLALIAWHRSDLGTLSRVPIASILVIVIGLPLAATIAGWLLAGREPPGVARQPLE